jgi:DNA replication and repair protein RecF
MHLSTLQLLYFKNYREASHSFSEHLNLITGPNGTGKTNLLDAVHFLCNTKSAFSFSDILAIQQGESFCRIEGVFKNEKKIDKVECICQQIGGKSFNVNGKPPEKLSSYIGRFPVVITSPYDTDLIREGSDVRRRFFDLVLSQSDNYYLEKLMVYNRLLKQRNALLKQLAETGKSNTSLLHVYDEQVLPLAAYIFESRKALTNHFLELTREAYQQLAPSEEDPDIHYLSECAEPDFETLFLANHKNDLAAQRTLLGPHTDDYEFTFKKISVKKFGSQGQQKTFALALRLAHFQFIKKTKNKKPILLLDDIFDRLDEMRIQKLAQMVLDRQFGQVFVTDANPRRVQQVFGSSEKDTHLILTA